MIDPDDKDEKTAEEAVVTSEKSSETAADAQATPPAEEKTEDKTKDKAPEAAKEAEKPAETKSSGMHALKREEPLPAAPSSTHNCSVIVVFAGLPLHVKLRRK